MTPSKTIRYNALAILAYLLWSSSFVTVKHALEYQSPLILAGLRFILAVLIQIPLCGSLFSPFRMICKEFGTVMLVSLFHTIYLYGTFFIGLQWVRGGGSFLQAENRDTGNKSDTGGGIVEGGLGIEFAGSDGGDNLRAEVALSLQQDEFDDVSSDITVLMFNGYWDINTGTALTPYFLAGIGRANVDLDFDAGGSDDDSVLAYQFGGGFGYSLTENIVFDLKYKYFLTDDYDTTAFNARFSSHQVQAGLRYRF